MDENRMKDASQPVAGKAQGTADSLIGDAWTQADGHVSHASDEPELTMDKTTASVLNELAEIRARIEALLR